MLWLGLIATLIALIGSVLVCASALSVLRFRARCIAAPPDVAPEPVTILKPLYGAEPRLTENLASFIDQRWGAPVQIVAGLHSAGDPARAALAPLGPAIEEHIDARVHGANAKIGNLINLAAAARHDVIVLSDSDIAAPPDYLARVMGALAEPGVGVVTCAFVGRGDRGLWSRIAAAAPSYHFLPSVLLAEAIGSGNACMGATIAMRRATFEAIGGLAPFADTLADDHAIGEAVIATGQRLALAPVIVDHAHADADFGALWAHELRWSATVRDLRPAGYVGATLLHPMPFALLALALMPGWASGAALVFAIAARLAVVAAVDRLAGRPTIGWYLLPLRDLLSFAVHIAALFVRQVEWRDAQLAMREAGRIEVRGA